ncbi:MAG: THUMP domain-containing protein [Sulfolobales archaeon]
MEFNLMIIHEPGVDNYSWVRNYIKQLLGDRVEYVSSYQSVILYLAEDPHEVAKLIRESLTNTSSPVIKVIPIDYVVDPLINEVSRAVSELSSRIPSGQTFRITLEGHLLYDEEGFLKELGSLEAIKELAKYVDRPVNLDNPDWIIYVRVVRFRKVLKKAAVSLLKPEELRRL